jgi:anti-sigma factor RsiW
MSGRVDNEITCQQLVELVTDYLEGSMPPTQRLRFEEHIAFCEPCVRYLEQMRGTIAMAGTLRENDLDDDSRDAMLRVLRGFAG